MMSIKKMPDKSALGLGSPEGAQSSTQVWSPANRVDVWELRREGYSVSQIARAYGISYDCVNTQVSYVKRAFEIADVLVSRGHLAKYTEINPPKPETKE